MHKDEQTNEPQMTEDAPDFRSELCALLNRHSAENRSDTPDWILRDFLYDSLEAFDKSICQRSKFYGEGHEAED